MHRVLITGASGLLGRAVFSEFHSHPEWETCGLAFSRASGKLFKVDLTDEQQVKKIISDFKPSIIIHCAAKRKPDEVEQQQEATHALNVSATHSICQIACKYIANQQVGMGVPVIYISTDYVFDGKSPPYGVDAATNPLNKYGVSKLGGEHEVFRVSKDNLVLRVPVLYGDVEKLAESAVTCLFTAVTSQTDVMMSHYEIKFPTHVADVSMVLRDLAERKLADKSLSGVFHWSGDERLTKYEQCLIMSEVFDLPSGHVTADKQPSGGAPRPRDPQLDTARVRALGINHQRKFKDTIRGVLQPHYKP